MKKTILLLVGLLFVSVTIFALPPQIEADAMFRQANNAFKTGDYQLALKSFKKIVSLKQKNPDIELKEYLYFGYGNTLMKLRKYSDARWAFEKYLVEEGSHSDFYEETLDKWTFCNNEVKKEEAAKRKRSAAELRTAKERSVIFFSRFCIPGWDKNRRQVQLYLENVAKFRFVKTNATIPFLKEGKRNAFQFESMKQSSGYIDKCFVRFENGTVKYITYLRVYNGPSNDLAIKDYRQSIDTILKKRTQYVLLRQLSRRHRLLDLELSRFRS